MKALIISNIYRRMSPFYRSMIVPLEALGYEIHIASNIEEATDCEECSHVTFHHVDFVRSPYSLKNIKAFFQLISILRKEKYDLVHCNTPVASFLGRICARLFKVPVIMYTPHGFNFYNKAPLLSNIIYKNVERIMGRVTDAIITINAEDYNAAKKMKLRKKEGAYYVPGVGIEVSSYKICKGDKKGLCRELGIPDDSIIAVTVGELNSNKNPALSIRALAKQAVPKNVHLALCGRGPKRDELIELSKSLGVGERVHFLGFRNDIPYILKSSDIYIMTSFKEGLPRAIMEAMASGLPVLTSNSRGNCDLLSVEGGYMFSPRDEATLAERLAELALSEDTRLRMGAFNENASIAYESSRIIKMMEEVYRSVLKLCGSQK